MKLPLPTYRHSGNIYQLIEAISMFVAKIDDAIKSLIADPTMRFHGKNHLVRLVVHHSGLPTWNGESYKDVEEYLGEEGIESLLRDFGV